MSKYSEIVKSWVLEATFEGGCRLPGGLPCSRLLSSATRSSARVIGRPRPRLAINTAFPAAGLPSQTFGPVSPHTVNDSALVAALHVMAVGNRRGVLARFALDTFGHAICFLELASGALDAMYDVVSANLPTITALAARLAADGSVDVGITPRRAMEAILHCGSALTRTEPPVRAQLAA